MKKTMLLAALAVLCGFTASADEWKIDGEFKQLTPKKMPARWVINPPTFKEAKATVVAGKEAKENAVKIESKGKVPTLYSYFLAPVKAGDKVEIEFEAMGKGKACIGAYLYGKGYITTASKTVAVDSPAKFTKYKTIVTLQKTAKPYTGARAIFGVVGAGTITFTDLEFEIKK